MPQPYLRAAICSARVVSGPDIAQHKICPCFRELKLSPGPLGNLLTPLTTTCRAESSWWSICHTSSWDKARAALCSGGQSLGGGVPKARPVPAVAQGQQRPATRRSALCKAVTSLPSSCRLKT